MSISGNLVSDAKNLLSGTFLTDGEGWICDDTAYANYTDFTSLEVGHYVITSNMEFAGTANLSDYYFSYTGNLLIAKMMTNSELSAWSATSNQIIFSQMSGLFHNVYCLQLRIGSTGTGYFYPIMLPYGGSTTIDLLTFTLSGFAFARNCRFLVYRFI